ncbi:MAG: preprotein translocase subunit SecE [Alphaproteobacteria bacterium]|nr:preprotein translocase subunit SecE [Alphaproteobacteria bacterium]
MAKVSPAEFVRQVRAEAIRKVTWPTTREAGITTLTVVAKIVLVPFFFLLVDLVFAEGIQIILGLGRQGF